MCHLILFLLVPRERVPAPKDDAEESNELEAASVASTLHSPPSDGSDNPNANGPGKIQYTPISSRSLLKSASISASKCIGVVKKDTQVSNGITYMLSMIH